MKVLWLINSPIPAICEKAGLPMQVKEGWITGLYNSMMQQIKENNVNLELAIVFPQMHSRDTIEGELDGNRFFGFYKEEDKPYKYNAVVTERLKAIVNIVKPDVVHIAGTEYDHAYSMTQAFPQPERTVVSIQGLTSVYAGHYMADLPFRIRYGFTFRDLVKLDNLYMDQRKYYKRGAMEIKTIKGAGSVIGRTDWDKMCTRNINGEAVYYHCGEILRNTFYSGERWDMKKCNKHSIFVSQGYYPIKGLHYMLEALADIKKFYPDVMLNVAGGVTLNNKGLKPRLKQKIYQKYLVKLINKYNLWDNVKFLPALNEEQMKAEYLKANVFVSPSAIENSPNSLGEGMIMGVPCVSSLVGGVANMLLHENEGFTYQHDATYMLAYYVMEIFKACDRAEESISFMTDNARRHAKDMFNKEKNALRMIEIYGEIYERNVSEN